MKKRRILRRLAGHLVTDTDEQRRNFDLLYKALGDAELPDDDRLSIESDFSIGKADLFFDETIPKQRVNELDTLARRIEEREEAPRSLVFVREVPIRDALLYASVPSWGAGARLSQSIGPFVHKDGRRFWFDFYPVAKLTALYVQGVAEPALLYKDNPRRKPTQASVRARATAEYTLGKGSIWINARFLASNAPAGSYVGLTIDSGRLVLSAAPTNQNGKMTVPSNTTVSVQLDLPQATVTDADQKSPYGMDARDLQLDLPRSFSFHFSGQSHGIDAVSDAGWELYGQALRFTRGHEGGATYDPLLQRVVVPFVSSEETLQIRRSRSAFHMLRGEAEIVRSAWALPIAAIDISRPPEAQGTGALLVQTNAGLIDTWPTLQGGGLHLAHPALLVSPGSILLADLTNGNPHARQSVQLWRDELNTFGSSVELTFPFPALFFYAANAGGVELFLTLANADFRVDRPVKVNGEPPSVRSKNSLLMIAATAAVRLIYLFDDNLLQDASPQDNTAPPPPIALALTNALFKVTRPNGALLFGSLSDDFGKVDTGFMFLTFGLLAYLPTLPDPYAANLGVLRRQIRGRMPVAGTTSTGAVSTQSITAWLVCRVRWAPPGADDGFDEVEVSFHFAPLSNQFGGISLEPNESQADDATSMASSSSPTPGVSPQPAVSDVAFSQRVGAASISRLSNEISNAIAVHNSNAGARNAVASFRAAPEVRVAAAASTGSVPLPNYGEQWDSVTFRLRQNIFALLDVSTNADLCGVSFDVVTARDQFGTTTHVPVPAAASAFPVQVQGMDVVSQGRNVKVFTVPMISWEPVINLSQSFVAGDPLPGFNYYPDDGGPTQILNNSDESVTLAPLPLTGYLVDRFAQDPEGFAAVALMTLPFGLKALAVLQDPYTFTDENGATTNRRGTELLLNAEEFEDDVKGGLQLQLNAGAAFIKGESDMFVGSTLQLNNVLDLFGNSQGNSTLGGTVTKIFNNEFLLQPFNLYRQRGVPLTRIDLSGYGASTYSNWLNPTAAFAETSQARFDVFVGRCAHEIIQVKSIIYPWAIKVVRTITIFRVGSGYVYRVDSGWRAESNGEFDFRYFVNETPVSKVEKASPFHIHPGIVKGLFNVQNIIETDDIAIAAGQMVADKIVDENGLFVDNPAPGDALAFELQPVYFDADVEIDNVLSGFTTKKIGGVDRTVVPSKKVLGYVQVAPRGIPITSLALRDLILVQLGSIGGPIDCEIDLAGSGQKMRLTRFDVNNSFGANGSDLVFPVAARGNVLLPKDGSWTMVKHERNSGEVTPVPPNLSVPVIRQGRLVADGAGQKLDTPIQNVLLRVANPSELLRPPVDDTINYGFLQSTDTQKALVLTPAFEIGKTQLFSKTPPLFVDAFRIVNSKSIFPNIGNAENNLGEAISLISNGTEFLKGSLQDIGTDVWSLMDITAAADNAAEQGYQLLKQVATFDLPSQEFELIDVGDGNFRIYIEYEQKDNDGNQQAKGSLDFNIDSMAASVADTWKSRMGNIGLVVDLAGIERLMTIRGNWDSKKGSSTSYPQPDIKFADELQPVIDILEILQQLQGGDYAGAVANGLKLAMSNKAGTWEYKFEASKEIPVLRFPVPDAIYNDPNTPFKLEAGLKIGAYFNAALMVTNNANDLLPSAGGLLGFYGRLSVMCVSVSAATIYAIGQVNLDIAADTKIGPSLRMKFGFGAQIVVGLPVAGNVSVLFVVGVEIFAAAGIVEVTAFMLFEGHAEILGGLVSITIRIEAKGTVSKKAIGGGSRTDLACQVTFGLDISIFLVINISFETSWSEQRQIA
jgi:hypothetical protein